MIPKPCRMLPFFRYLRPLPGACLWPVLLSLVWLVSSCSRHLSPGRPELARTDFRLDSLPDSEINIPVQVNLQPLYALAEKNIDTVYTSPRYPQDWIQEGCGVRYKYHFRRGPLQLRASGTVLDLGFTGYYQVIGSTRACLNGAVLSPWTPACRCGFEEAERRVQVNFSTSLFLTPDYRVRLAIRRLEPQALDKCQVCFWSQDITRQVMDGLKAQLDSARAGIESRFGTTDLHGRFQQLWDKLREPVAVYGMGWLRINPVSLRINTLYAHNDSLHINLGLAARPSIALEKPDREEPRPVPNLGAFSNQEGFNVFLDARLDYDSLGKLVNARLQNTQFTFSKGPLTKQVVIRDCRLSGQDNERLIIRVEFGGSYEGVAYFTGRPAYDDSTRVIELRDLDFDVRTRDVLLKSARWLFSRKITAELKKYARIELGGYIDSARALLGNQLNREWVPGMVGTGRVDNIRLVGIYPLTGGLVIRSHCSGSLAVTVRSIGFSL